MDHDRFDLLARSVFAGARRSRRAAVGALFGAALLGADPGVSEAKKRKRRSGGQAAVGAADTCYPNTKCTPGRGKNTSGCDYTGSTLFRNLDVRGANLSNSSFFGADLTGADFRGANLGGSCFATAKLTGAKLGNSVNLGGAVFCGTTMPDGSINNSGCLGNTPCCHQRLQSCPDGEIQCWIQNGAGCDVKAGTLPGKIPTCYKFPYCYPCEHDQDYWSNLCNQQFPSCGGDCWAILHEPFLPAGGYCCPPHTCI